MNDLLRAKLESEFGTIADDHILDVLSKEEQLVLYYRFVHGMTLKEAGNLINRNAEFVRQRQNIAFRKLHTVSVPLNSKVEQHLPNRPTDSTRALWSYLTSCGLC